MCSKNRDSSTKNSWTNLCGEQGWRSIQWWSGQSLVEPRWEFPGVREHVGREKSEQLTPLLCYVCACVCTCVTSVPQWCWGSCSLQGLFLEHQTPCSTVRGQEAAKYVVTRFSENLLELSLYWLETISMLRLDSKTFLLLEPLFECPFYPSHAVSNLSIWWGCSSIPLQVGKKSAVISLCSHLWSPWMHPRTCHHKPSFIIVISYARCFLPS